MIFELTWIPPWIAIKSSVCARYDCNELRMSTDTQVRRYCPRHAAEWDAIQLVREEIPDATPIT